MAAQRHPVSTDVPTQLLTDEERRQQQIEKNQGLIVLLDSWMEATEEEVMEQRETWEYLKRALDEDRPSYRKLFPE
jgi:hypothetical protein